MATLTDGDLTALRNKLLTARAGATEVVDVQVDRRFDQDGEEYVEVTLVVSEPPSGETRPLDDAFELRQTARRGAADLGFVSLVITMTMSGNAGTDDGVTDCERVERGEEIVISRAGTPVARVVPVVRPRTRTGRGSLRGVLTMSDDWDSPEVNEAIARDFGPTSGAG